jgi:hypothetical protein
MVSEVFLTTLSVSTFGFFLAILGVCYKSKCKTIDCCCIKIVRDIEAEEQIDEHTIELGGRRTNPELTLNSTIPETLHIS